LLFNFALDYAIRSVQVDQYGLKLNGKHQLLIYVDDIKIFGVSVRTIKARAEALVVASTKFGLELNADKNTRKYMVMSRDQNARRSHRVRTDNSFCERV
jgi:hypothetical protein